jgi:hypothetical protein
MRAEICLHSCRSSGQCPRDSEKLDCYNRLRTTEGAERYVEAPDFNIPAHISTDHEITTRFGATGTRNDTHRGLDFSAPFGTSERAFLTTDKMPAGSDILKTGGEAATTGNYLTVDTEVSYICKGQLTTEDVFQAYLHQSSVLIQPGQTVSSTEALGLTGNTGY